MFKVGDTVRNVAANVVGVVIEIDGDTVYLEQDNGCEVDFVASADALTWRCPRCSTPMRIGPQLTPAQLAFQCSYFDSS